MSYTSKEEARTPFLRLLEHGAQVRNWGRTVRPKCFRPWFGKAVWGGSVLKELLPDLKVKDGPTLYVASVEEIWRVSRDCAAVSCAGRARRKPRCERSHGSQGSAIGTVVLAPKSPDRIPCSSCVHTGRVISFNEWVCNLLLLIKVISLPEFKNPG